MRLAVSIGGPVMLLFSAPPSCAQEVATYSYDALGRLTSTVVSGGPDTGVAVSTNYDPAGNRTQFSTTGASAALLRKRDMQVAWRQPQPHSMRYARSEMSGM